MSFLSKVELKKQLSDMGIQVEGNYVRKKDIENVIPIIAAKGILKNFRVFRSGLNVFEKNLKIKKNEYKQLKDFFDKFFNDFEKINPLLKKLQSNLQSDSGDSIMNLLMEISGYTGLDARNFLDALDKIIDSY